MHLQVVVVFFDARIAEYLSDGDYGDGTLMRHFAVLRELTIAHLTAATSFTVHNFPGDHHSDDFRSFIRAKAPTYLISQICRFRPAVGPHFEVETAMAPHINAFMASSLTSNVNIVLLSDMTFAGFRMFAWVIYESSIMSSPRHDRLATITRSAIILEDVEIKKTAIILEDILEDVEKAARGTIPLAAKVDLLDRECLAIACVRRTLSQLREGANHDCDRDGFDLCMQFFLLHVALLRSHTPPYRPAILATTSVPYDQGLLAHLQQLWPMLLANIQHTLIAMRSWTDVGMDCSLADVYDIRFLCALVLSASGVDAINDLSQPGQLPESSRVRYITMCSLAGLESAEPNLLEPLQRNQHLVAAFDHSAEEAEALRASDILNDTVLSEAVLKTNFLQDIFRDTTNRYRNRAADPNDDDEVLQYLPPAILNAGGPPVQEDEVVPDEWDENESSDESEHGSDSSDEVHAAPLPVRTRVVLEGLVLYPELNGASGEIDSYDSERARYAVRLDATAKLSDQNSVFLFQSTHVRREMPEDIAANNNAHGLRAYGFPPHWAQRRPADDNTLSRLDFVSAQLLEHDADYQGPRLQRVRALTNALFSNIRDYRNAHRGEMAGALAGRKASYFHFESECPNLVGVSEHERDRVIDIFDRTKSTIAALREEGMEWIFDHKCETHNMEKVREKVLSKVNQRLDVQKLKQKLMRRVRGFADSLLGGVIQAQPINEETLAVQNRAPPAIDDVNTGDEEMNAGNGNAGNGNGGNLNIMATRLENDRKRMHREYEGKKQLFDSFKNGDGTVNVKQLALDVKKLNTDIVNTMTVKRTDLLHLYSNYQGQPQPHVTNAVAAFQSTANPEEILLPDRTAIPSVTWEVLQNSTSCLLIDVLFGDIERDIDALSAVGASEREWAASRVLQKILCLETIDSAILTRERTMTRLNRIMERLGIQANELPRTFIVRGASNEAYQLEHMPDLLKRPEGEADPRVSAFHPDDWQAELLDIVDNGDSALICAPTSSGKTFISFYVMEQVLRERTRGQGVVVYVAPSKALVNQVQADIVARYKKSYKNDGRRMCGVFTRDFRIDENNCQILVTVPACLEILMLHSHSSQFSGRIRYVIFDEVHNISTLGGHVWERLLLSVPCPFLALSATVGDPESFLDWLKVSHRDHHGEVHLIGSRHHRPIERYNDLALKIYNPDVAADEEQLKLFNPLSLVDPHTLSNGVPEQLTLLPEQCLALYNYLHSRLTEQPWAPPLRRELDDLWRCLDETPANAAPRVVPPRVSTTAVATFQRELKVILSRVAGFDDAQAIVQEFDDGNIPLEDWTRDKIAAHLLPCIRKLENNRTETLLPAIVFHYSVKGIKFLGKYLLKQLELEQEIYTLWRYAKQTLESEPNEDLCARLMAMLGPRPTVLSSIEHAKILMTTRERLDSFEALASDLRASRERANEHELELLMQTYEREKREWCRKPEPKDPEPQPPDTTQLQPDYYHVDHRFAFGKPPSLTEIKECFASDYKRDRLMKRPFGITMTRLMMRGIALHFSELNMDWKYGSERFFRQKRLAVVIASGTLAQGINMPARSVVVAGNSAYIGSTEFHQMAGRAGRRNFDNRGDVVIMGVSKAKLRRLLLPPLPELTGHAPLTPVLVLRMLLRYCTANAEDKFSMFHASDRNDTADRTEIVAMIRRMMTNPLCGFVRGEGVNLLSSQLPDFFVFTVDFLEKIGVVRTVLSSTLHRTLKPTAMCSFLAHLWYFEPNNIVFATAVYRGLLDPFFEDIPEPSLGNDFGVDVHRTVLLLVSHLLYPNKVLPPWVDVEEARDQTRRLFDVELPALPPTIAQFVSDFNDQVRTAFTGYVRNFSRHHHHQRGNRDKLHLPGCHEALPHEEFDGTGDIGQLLHQFEKLRFRFKARSPFVAVDQKTDTFSSVEELVSDTQHQIYIDMKMMPVVVQPSSTARKSACILDLFKSGKPSWIKKFHGISSSKQYQTFFDVNHTLKVITNALRCRLPRDPTWDSPPFRLMRVFESTSKAFDTKFRHIYKN